MKETIVLTLCRFVSSNQVLVRYTLIPLIPLLVIAILSVNPNTWRTSDVHHFYFEMFAVILAAVLAFYYISRAYTLNDTFSLFVGIGFLTNALIDLMHALVSFSLVNEPLFLKYFIPQTWFAGRIFLSAMFVVAIVMYSTFSKDSKSLASSSAASSITASSRQKEISLLKEEIRYNKLRNKLILSLIMLATMAASIAISSLFSVYPGIVIDDFPLHRPYEIPALALFLVALFYFYKNQLYKINDVFYKGILASLLIDSFAQIIMSYSATSFDTAHNVAHILKNAGYFVNIIALALSSIQYNTMLRQSIASLKESNIRLKEGEEVIRVQYEKLKETDKMKDEFINIAAHELRTPIQPILGLTQFLLSKTKNIKDHELLVVVVRNAKRLLRLTDEILDVTKIESHSLKLSKELFNLNDVIKNAINDIATNKEESNNLNLLFQSEEDIFIEADRNRLVQVISNLLSNAVKFTKEEGGMITITAEKKDTQVIVKIKDTGTGIDPEILPRLFSKFASKSFEGTGLGLFIARNIVEAHSGKIWAENNADGKG
ncbi:MAG TPA: ATP-binding protein, partial [Nitrososphaeraceae archaeon]|nr:ATP-binding protein [Nitrososphaeraceae archaeon]